MPRAADCQARPGVTRAVLLVSSSLQSSIEPIVADGCTCIKSAAKPPVLVERLTIPDPASLLAIAQTQTQATPSRSWPGSTAARALPASVDTRHKVCPRAARSAHPWAGHGRQGASWVHYLIASEHTSALMHVIIGRAYRSRAVAAAPKPASSKAAAISPRTAASSIVAGIA
jgi:hypothetical protein